jgi:DNA-directed RNA polymerase subunit beta'
LPLEDGRFASSDVNELYAELIVQNDFARWAVEAARPRAILEEEARRLGEAYARLLLSGFGPHTSTAPEGRPLRGLAASLVAQGPQLVDKQVDFSGFGQLVLDDALAPRSCRLPRAMALELWKPHVFGALEELGHVTNIKVAKRVVDATIEALHDEPPCEPGPAEREGDFGVPPERVLDVLEQVVVGRPVLLAGKERVIARRVMLWDEVAIAVDPFTALLLDDDAVAVHVPLTDEAQRECDAMPDLTSSAEREPSGWLSGILFGSAAPCGLARAAIERHIDPLTDPVVRLALGLPPRDG